MKKVYPTQGRLRELFLYDAETGMLLSKKCRLCGTPNVPNFRPRPTGYFEIFIDGQRFLVHRLIWIYFYGSIDPKLVIDHMDGKKTNNRTENLRLVPQYVNTTNNRRRKDNTSGYTGVHWDKKRKYWRAEIGFGGGKVRLQKQFKTFYEALAARKALEVMYGFHPNHGRA